MDTTEVKRYLSRMRLAALKVRQISEQYKEMIADVYGVNGVRYDKERVCTSGYADKMAEMFDKLDVLNVQLIEAKANAWAVKEDAIRMIHSIDDEKSVDILYRAYIVGDPLKKVADDIGHEYKWLCKLHGKALLQLGEVLERTRPNTT